MRLQQIGLMLSICFAGIVFAATDKAGSVIDFSSLPQSGVKIIERFEGVPDKDGILGQYELIVPEFQHGCYFSDRKSANSWYGGGNQIAPHAFSDNFGELCEKKYEYRGAFVILELKKGGYLAIVPMAGAKTMAWLKTPEKNKLTLLFGTLGTKGVSCDVPLLAWAKSDDVYTACRQAWAEAVTCKLIEGRTNFRYKKDYPECFKYLGWCTWEEYKKDISESLLTDAVEKIEKSGLPIRYILIDDGHQTQENDRLKSFTPDRKKFPNGWAPVLNLRKPDKIRWIGLWHSFGGLQETIHYENDFGSLNEHLMKVKGSKDSNGLLPKNNPESSQAFYDALIGSVKKFGFDFVKIDFQMRDLAWRLGTDNAVEASANCSQSLETAVKRDFGSAMINCMAHNSVCIFNTRYSNIMRCSMDYKVGNAPKGRNHLWQSYGNTPWQCQTVWSDHDMFHSCDPYCGRMMAVSKAMSGGPVYMSDAPEKFVAEYIRPLCYGDGELLRPLAPAGPLPESIFVNPLKELVPYRVIAPAGTDSAAVVVYNLYDSNSDTVVKGFIRPSDYQYASDMIQPYPGKWQMSSEGLIIYDWYSGKAEKLGNEYSFELKGFSDRLPAFVPVRNGWAVIGRTDKYLSPAAVEVTKNIASELTLRMAESGQLAIWCEKGKPSADGVTFIDMGSGLFKANIPVGERNKIITIHRI